MALMREKLNKVDRDEKIFSLNDLIRAGFITENDIELATRYQEAVDLTEELFGEFFK